MKKYKTGLTIWLPLLLWAMIIFTFSSQPYEDQDLRPFIQKHINEEEAEELLAHIDIQYADKNIGVEEEGAAGLIEFFIRKGAHLFSFALLGLLILRALLSLQLPMIKAILFSLFLGVLYAATDEWHQSFTPNRTPLVSDVILDSLGVFIGIANYIVFVKVFQQQETK